MEYGTVLIVLLVDTVFGIMAYRRWLRRHGEFARVQAEFIESLKAKREDGALDQYIQDFTTGKTTLFKKRRQISTLKRMSIAMILGVAVPLIILRIVTLDLWIRTIIAIMATLPFLYEVSAAIAEEVDENRILSFERAARERLRADRNVGSVESLIAEGV